LNEKIHGERGKEDSGLTIWGNVQVRFRWGDLISRRGSDVFGGLFDEIESKYAQPF